MSKISFCQIKLSLILHLLWFQKSWLCDFCFFINTAEFKIRVHIKIKHQSWSHLFKEWFHYQVCLIQQYHIYHETEIYFAVISSSVNKTSFNSSRFSFMAVSSFIPLLTNMIINHKNFVKIWQILDWQIIT